MEARILDRIAQVPAQAWDAVAGTHPFVRHAFLAALEDTGCACPATGWRPRHLVLQESGRILGALPLYEKTHSYGEFVFDWAWADAYRRHGMAYYPKWIAAIPFTPVTGPRLLAPTDSAKAMLVAEAVRHARGPAEIGARDELDLALVGAGSRHRVGVRRAGRIIDHCREDGKSPLGRAVYQTCQSPGSDQRDIAIKDQDGMFSRDPGQYLRYRVTRAELRRLLNPFDVKLRKGGAYALAAMSVNHENTFGAESRRGVVNVLQ